jgi:outer membrane murein-binding lipoprotein Lpp
MTKFLVIASAALLSVGCASKGSVEALSSRVDALEASHKAIEADHSQIKADHEAIKADVSSLSQKLDAAFVKKNLK